MASLAGPELIDPALYAQHGYPHETFARLRSEAPVYWYEEYELPFWALTRRAEMVEVARQPERFASGPRFQILVGCCDDSHIRAKGFPPADAFKLAILQDP